MIFNAKSAALRVAISTIFASALAASPTLAQVPTENADEAILHTDPVLDEIIVTTSMQKTAAETALPVNILTGELLRERAAGTLGETLDQLLGVNNASFGRGVGLPVIRGQSGNRVQVLQGGVANIDASAVSPDHANSVEAALASRIEVLRGPATMLYGNGAIGGVVNVIDNRIPEYVPDALTGLVETRHNTNNDEQMSVFRLDGGAGQIAWHIDGLYRDSNDTRVRGYATNPSTVDIDDPEELEELLETRGHIPNSSARSKAMTLGTSWVFDGGFMGVAVNSSRSNYGLPPAAHGVHEDHDDEEHEDDDHNDDDAHDDGVRIAMKQDRVDFRSQLQLGGLFENIEGRLSFMDYEHAELEADGGVGTVYKNSGFESRFTLAHRPIGSLRGVTGAQIGRKEFSAAGEEAYIPATDIDSLALFTVQSIDNGPMTYELGLRGEHQSHEPQSGTCKRSLNSVSASASGLYRYAEDTNLLVAFAHSQRTPTVEELYSNIESDTCAEPDDEHDLIAHFATNRFEIGNPNAGREKSNNLELGWRRYTGPVTGELNLFYNSISDYLYLQDTGDYEDGIQIARIDQRDATFRGVEAEVRFQLGNADHWARTGITFFGDYVRASFDDRGAGSRNVPRIPAYRFGAELSHAHDNWVYKVRATQVGKQERVALNETPTDSYTLLNVVVDYHARVMDRELLVFLKGNNLLNEEARNHASHLKDVAPQPGRGFEVGLRLDF